MVNVDLFIFINSLLACLRQVHVKKNVNGVKLILKFYLFKKSEPNQCESHVMYKASRK